MKKYRDVGMRCEYMYLHGMYNKFRSIYNLVRDDFPFLVVSSLSHMT